MYHVNLWNELETPWRNWNRLFDTAQTAEVKNYHPACDIEETENHYLMTFDVPGMAKSDIHIEVKDGELHLSGERKFESKTKTSSERFFGKFYRTFTLPENVNANAIEAHCENGVLAIAIPKPEAVKPKQVKIEEGKSPLFSKMLNPKEGPKQ